MAIKKVTYKGKVLIDLSHDTVTPEVLLEGYTAHDSKGNVIVGTLVLPEPSAEEEGS